MSVNYKIESKLVDDAISNCHNVAYPCLVTGQDYADDLAHALSVIKVLLVQVEKLERYIDSK